MCCATFYVAQDWLSLPEQARREIVQRIAPHLPLVRSGEAHEDRLEPLLREIVERLLLEWHPRILGAAGHVEKLQTRGLLGGVREQFRHDHIGTDGRGHTAGAAEH